MPLPIGLALFPHKFSILRLLRTSSFAHARAHTCLGRAGKCNYRDVLAKLKSNLSADTSQVLDGLLVELKVGGRLCLEVLP